MPQERLQLFAKNVALAIREEPHVSRLTGEVKRLLAAAVQDPEFALDCVDVATSAMGSSSISSPWNNPPIVDDDDAGFSVRLIFWPPGSKSDPHRHTFWTVTAVLWNELTFVTYVEPPVGGMPAEVAREFHGPAGAVGVVHPPCIHQVANASPAPAISVHVFSGPRAQTADGRASYERGATTWFGDDHAEDGPRPQGSDIVAALIALLGSLSGERVVSLLERLFAVGNVSSKLACTKVLSRHDPHLAGQWLYHVAAACGGEDQQRLRAIAARLTSA